jgi:hypothetical protein
MVPAVIVAIGVVAAIANVVNGIIAAVGTGPGGFTRVTIGAITATDQAKLLARQ